MGFQGFDPVKLTDLAAELDSLSRNAGSLHSRLATVLTTAQQNLPPGQSASRDPDLQDLVGGVAQIPLLGTSRLPGSLTAELGDMQASMKRRITQLESLQKFAGLGYPVDPSVAFLDETGPDGKKVDDALKALKALNGADFGVNGNRDDLEKVTKELTGLTSAELDALFTKADPADLAHYNKLLSDTGDSFFSPFDHNGLPEAERENALSLMLAKVGADNLGTFTTAFPEIQPTFENSAAYTNHGNNQNGQNNSGIHWQAPTDPLFNGPVSANDVNQRQFGDCWFVASLSAVALKDPRFIQDGIKQNPNGTVSVRIWDKSGNSRWVTVTADLPSDTNGDPISTYGNGDTWPAYYEKAFAQTYRDENGAGGYGGIEGDDPKNAAPFLTGHSGSDIDKSGGFLGLQSVADTRFSTLKKQFDAGKAVTVSTPDDESLDKDHPEEWGGTYHSNHAYYVRGFTSDGRIILGNPWGYQGYPPIYVTQDQFDQYFQDPEAYEVP
ncbi:C2 family cysteine protease [Streptomyces sp. NBC_01190]|uniref:C2 family cysteine protease n=1 Tax=Streptomyces sp. NBC_01190 TaxID=2903767 RepID=UPI00386486E9|nr:C2 family cysteine protease [Streptomyces sp. NBC_01190]